jgi:hypothetical protein
VPARVDDHVRAQPVIGDRLVVRDQELAGLAGVVEAGAEHGVAVRYPGAGVVAAEAGGDELAGVCRAERGLVGTLAVLALDQRLLNRDVPACRCLVPVGEPVLGASDAVRTDRLEVTAEVVRKHLRVVHGDDVDLAVFLVPAGTVPQRGRYRGVARR